jgi:hypothetical protein
MPLIVEQIGLSATMGFQALLGESSLPGSLAVHDEDGKPFRRLYEKLGDI